MDFEADVAFTLKADFRFFGFITKNTMKFLPFLVTFYSAKKDCDDEDKRIECEGLELFLFILNLLLSAIM